MNPAGEFASPGLRLGAFVMDGVTRIAIAGILIGVGRTVGYSLSVLLLIVYLGLELFLFATGRSPGKALLRLYVVDGSGFAPGFLAMVIREWVLKAVLPSLVLRLAPSPILKVVLSFAVLASFLMFTVDDENRQNWYDRLLGTFVVQKPQES